METRNSLFFLIFIGAISCASLNAVHRQMLRNSVIVLSSVLEDDTCTLLINDSVYLVNAIKTDRSLGIDLNNQLEIDSISNPAKFAISFNGKIFYGEGIPSESRELRLDTLLDLRQGKYILIKAGIDEVVLVQSKKKLKLL